ncbi:MAG: sigma-70 family RNA polymerase sigma factor [Chitinophagaceae bacterium]
MYRIYLVVQSILKVSNEFFNNHFMLRFERGEEQAFDYLFREYFVALTHFANYFIKNTADAEDIVQDCFVSLWKRRKELHNIEYIRTYLYTAVRYQCLKQIDKRKRNPGTGGTDGYELPAEQQIIAAETARELHKMLEALTPQHRDVLTLFYLEGKSYQEIGKLMEISPQLARLHRFRAILALRKTKIPLS